MHRFFFIGLVQLISFSFASNCDLRGIERHANYKKLPWDSCGESFSDRIIGGKAAQLGEFTFMASIGYTLKNCAAYNRLFKPTYLCGGSLITENAVLTAAHCFAGSEKSFCFPTYTFQPQVATIVRLGEYNTESHIDCSQGVCAHPTKEIAIKRIITHENFESFKNDIALVILKESVKFTDWITPICLFGSDYRNFQRGLVAGWGVTDVKLQKQSTILQKLEIPIMDFGKCRKEFPIYNIREDRQLCAGGIIGEDSCGGDSGGPFFAPDMTDHGPRYHIIGIVSYGPEFCGKYSTPAIYTVVNCYAKWILDHLP